MIIFNDDIQKARPRRADAYIKLNLILQQKEPRLARVLARFLRGDNIITYPEIRQAIETGQIDTATIERWRQKYSKLVTDEIYPEWIDTMNAAAEQLHNKYPEFLFNAGDEGTRNWAATRGAEMVVDITTQQEKALRTMVERYSYIPDISVDQFAQVIRPVVGLDPIQTVANMRYFEKVRNNLLNAGATTSRATQQAKTAAIKYAERQHRYRAMRIARTELCAAYNQGEYQGIKQAQARGYMGHVVKEWSSAGDDRVCDTCKALDGTRIEMDEEWDSKSRWDKRTPPAHPHCRCVMKYVED